MDEEIGKEQRNCCIKCVSGYCNCLSTFESKVQIIIDELKLPVEKKRIIRKRFIKEIMYYEKRSKTATTKYNTCRTIIAIGSMLLPTLQTIQGSTNVAGWNTELFWGAIGTSLSVMVANTFISMFQLDKKYFMYHLTAEKLKALGWKYFELSGDFAEKTHEQNWIKFWNEVEKVKNIQVTTEFADSNDQDKPDNTAILNQIKADEKNAEDNKRKDKAMKFLKQELKNKNKQSEDLSKDNIETLDSQINNNIEQIDIELDNVANNLTENISEDIVENVEHIIDIPDINTEEVLGNLQTDIINNIKK